VKSPRTALHQRGMGLLELVIAAILIAILIVVFFSRVVRLSAAVEREAMAQTVNALDAALRIRWLTLVVQHRESELAALTRGNPMRLLGEPPANYLGERRDVDPAAVPPRRWYYDLDRKLLVYRVANVDALEGGRSDPRRVRFRVVAERDDEGRIRSLALKPMEPYRWKPEE